MLRLGRQNEGRATGFMRAKLRSAGPVGLRGRPIYVKFDLDGAKVAPSGYVGVRCDALSLGSEQAVKEMETFQRIDWDGK